ELQLRIFDILGISPSEARRRFGFLLTALASGAPPHGGFAIGFDRVTMLLAGAESLRDVVAFPQTTQARALFEAAPTPIDPRELTSDDVRRIAEEGAGNGDRAGDRDLRIALPGARRIIQPKTAGQREYLVAMRENDIVIGIGPAGTGKTYLAVAMGVEALARKL